MIIPIIVLAIVFVLIATRRIGNIRLQIWQVMLFGAIAVLVSARAPVVLLLAKQCRLPPKLMLLALAFAVTIGSVMSPIGNPQNVLIAINGKVANPFVTFFRFLLIPTMVNLFLAFILLRLFYKQDPKKLRNRTF